MGWQAGVKYFDVAGVKNLNFQAEYNSVRPYSYQGQDSAIGYYHYNQSLGHPMGANFDEFLVMLNYQYKRFYASYKMSYIRAGTDSTLFKNFGNNVTDVIAKASTLTNVKMYNGIPYNTLDNEIKFGYILNPKINMVIEGKMQFRRYKANAISTDALKTNSFMISFATNIFNRYYDLPVLF